MDLSCTLSAANDIGGLMAEEWLPYRGQRIALIVPCYNEEAAIAMVIKGFVTALPEIRVFVFDNSSTDRTAEVAREAGAEVITVSLRGKGNVVRRMFADVDADVYLMVDGDATYDSSVARRLIDKLLDEHVDMVVGCRVTDASISNEAYRKGHQWGNRVLTKSIVHIFGGRFTDMLSGYRAFTRRYVKSFPALSCGFETETELTVHALELRMPYCEVQTAYGARLEGSESKLSTYRDGLRILKMIGRLYVSERPFSFFGMCGLLLALTSVLIALPVFAEYLKVGLVPRLPTAVLSASMMISALLSFVCGLILDNVTRGRHEMKRLAYLAVPAPNTHGAN
jgi:glycosyltransferase involved in cell wall biosynthesis